MSSENPATTGPSPGPQQPRWAWWVVGIVIPLVGLLVAVLLSGPDPSVPPGGQPSGTQPFASTGSIGQESTTASPVTSAEPIDARHGSDVVEADMLYGSYLELDTSEPVVSGIKGADIYFVALLQGPVLSVPGSASMLAPSADSDAAPTAEECADTVERNSTFMATVQRGDSFCLLTDEGRVAHLRVLTAPSSGTGKLDVTVWDTPGA
ncbi:hypothetical protein ACH4TV_10865 [Streptomyces sp. NPDC020898]|uniref:hypothetical protein n=1 Tax=Streptomyces sp. NPDC020898 TaxID=3365101 RepID=UPI0037B0927D